MARELSSVMQPDLFEALPVTEPQGLDYQPEFLSAAQEQHLVALLQTLPFEAMQYKQYTARRRVVSYGGRYDFDTNRLGPAPALPQALHPLRDAVAHWLGMAPATFTQVLVAEYHPSTPLGWHRDVPDFELIVGVSLLAEATMRFRRYPATGDQRRSTLKLNLQPRSIYVMRGPSRWEWQHSIAPVNALRYSITFRTPRAV